MKRIGLIVLIESKRDQRIDSTRSNGHFYTILGHNDDQSIIFFTAQRQNLIYRNMPIKNFWFRRSKFEKFRHIFFLVRSCIPKMGKKIILIPFSYKVLEPIKRHIASIRYVFWIWNSTGWIHGMTQKGERRYLMHDADYFLPEPGSRKPGPTLNL